MNQDGDNHHLMDSVIWMLDAPKEAKIQRVNKDLWVNYPAADRVFKTIDNMLNTPRGIQSPCLLVTGKSGAGKSSMVDQLKKRNKVKKAQSLVFISLGDNPTNQSIKGEISKSLGFSSDLSFSRSGELPPELIYAIRQRGVRGIVIDELNNALLVSKSEQRRNMTFLKGLGDKTNGLCVFGFGTPEASNAISSDPQLARRFYRIELPVWDETEEFRGFLHAIESVMPIRKPSRLYDQEKARYILAKTEGLMDDVIKIIRSAACYAISNDLDEITLDMLERAFVDAWSYD